MAGQIIVSSIKTDSDNSISFLANTGATIFSANLASGLSIDSFGNNTITSDKIVSVANTKIDGTINTNQIADSAITSEKIAVGAIPPSDNASALTTGTLPIARIADGTVTAAKLATGAAATNLGSYVTSVNGSTGAVTVSTTPPTTLNTIGTYAFVARPDGTPSNMTPGATFAAGSAGSQLRIAGFSYPSESYVNAGTGGTGVISGTWRLMSSGQTNGGDQALKLAVRIS